MYKPAPPRPKKTNIVRSRNGCKSCRERKTKCDEQRPICGTCKRLGKICETIRPEIKFRMVAGPSANGKPCSPTPSQELQSQVTSEQNSLSRTFGNLDLIKSLQHVERDIFYSTYWEDSCLPALHPLFHWTSRLAGEHPILSDAILALSSCNLSRQHAERRTLSTSSMGSYSPSLVHQTRSQLYYSSAIKRFTALNQFDYQSNATMVLAVLILFAYVESSMGNFHGFNCHVDGLTRLLTELPESSGDAMMNALLTSWMQVRYVVWWARAYFSSIDVHQQLPSISLPRSLTGGCNSIQERRVTGLSIMCESHRINSQTILRHWSHGLGSKDPHQDGHQVNDEEYTTYCLLLSEQSKRLDDWLASLPPSEQPIYTDVVHNSESDDSNPPIHFQTHDAALNFAYYVVARIMQGTGILRNLHTKDPKTLDHECREEEPWVRILLQIAKGADMHTSLSRNNYTIGFSGLLLAGLLRCQSLPLGLEIQSWLQKLQDLQPTEEGAFPVYQSLGVAKAINQQKMIGRDIFAVTQPLDDGGGTPKVTAYNSQSIDNLVFYGKCRLSGCLFVDCVSIDGSDGMG
ncbi:hypothetical protein BO94DRAFT_559182 [Aspergillus sclerotioniger CBS 115572]|uniref:Zn(2)-C6 fungal-type domain-containing protein n=1 Tax=Aspergillus sclerotioniger CBS 115572 TaxID=1450535 RepID=A0A317VUP2_9EURO|nr:hypothetical protein BO94DRAFT_559182 [Aspergillus sclerotioniger CBS 115572]PWY77319.1 hypothetical protein BO94DRAFT_559182 [Aspergillus sclerotioniger CBS 115572]